MKVCGVEEMRNLDQRATEEFGISQETLMENAGEAVYSLISKELKHIPGTRINKRFAIFAGPGNNGGDGFVVARKIHSDGRVAKVYLLVEKERFRGPAKINLEKIEGLPIEIRKVDLVDESLKEEVNQVDGIVDGIFGTGIDREIRGIYKEVIQLINESKKPVFSIDIPSGINGNTGQEMGISVKADYTITFGLPKIGNLVYPGYGRGGKLYLSHIGYPSSLQNPDWIKTEIFKPLPLPERRADTTKFSYGPVLVIAGAGNYYWAPFASAYSVLKAGGGYVFLACPESLAPYIAIGGREIVFLPQKKETEDKSLALEAKDDLLKAVKERGPKMVIMGPGLSLNEETQQLVRELAREIEKPLLIDGDGITAIAKEPEIIKERKAETILTPHTGEMARITKRERSEIERNRVNVLQETAKGLNTIIVLKGPHTLIGYPDGKVLISLSGDTEGKAGMATAGSGDVLNGTIAAMFCLGLPLEEAVPTGVFIHGLAGDLAAKEIGPDGIVAQDILNHLPKAVKYYRENFEQISENYYGKCFLI